MEEHETCKEELGRSLGFLLKAVGNLLGEAKNDSQNCLQKEGRQGH